MNAQNAFSSIFSFRNEQEKEKEKEKDKDDQKGGMESEEKSCDSDISEDDCLGEIE